MTLVACHTYQPENARCHWVFEEAPSCYPCLSSSRVILRPKFPGGALQLELVRDSCCYRMYLSTICYVLSCDPCKKNVEIECIIDDQQHLFTLQLFEGQQRGLLSDEARDTIIEALLWGSSVQIKAGIHQAEIIPNGFCEAFQKLEGYISRW